MIIDCVSDLHGFYPKLDGGDLLIVAGDLTKDDRIPSWKEFFEWIGKAPYAQKVYIGGNHDHFLEDCLSYTEAKDLALDWEIGNIAYLKDSGIEFEGLKIWGSPWVPYFIGMGSKYAAFTGTDKVLADKWAMIPSDTDILVTHGPPAGILDLVMDDIVGSESLRKELYGERIKPKLHVFGHIHEGYGHIPKMVDMPNTQFVNASHVNEYYQPINKPIRIVL